jgi:hypothetical protein
MLPQKCTEKELPKSTPQAKRSRRTNAPTSSQPPAAASEPEDPNQHMTLEALVTYGKLPVDPAIAEKLRAPLHDDILLAAFVNRKAAKLFKQVKVYHSLSLIHV